MTNSPFIFLKFPSLNIIYIIGTWKVGAFKIFFQLFCFLLLLF